MKVWVVEHFRYEETEIVDIFDSEEKANAEVERRMKTVPKHSRDWVGFDSMEYEVK